MINTAIEVVVDMYTQEYHPLAAVAKNVAAGAVLITAINALIVGYLIFIKKLLFYWVYNKVNSIYKRETVYGFMPNRWYCFGT